MEAKNKITPERKEGMRATLQRRGKPQIDHPSQKTINAIIPLWTRATTRSFTGERNATYPRRRRAV
jgi:hypothetical protein